MIIGGIVLIGLFVGTLAYVMFSKSPEKAPDRSPLANSVGWHPDPAGKHTSRYFDGKSWRGEVSDGGAMSVDALEVQPPPPTTSGSPDVFAAAPGSYAWSQLDLVEDGYNTVTPQSDLGVKLAPFAAPTETGWFPDPLNAAVARYCDAGHWTGRKRKVVG